SGQAGHAALETDGLTKRFGSKVAVDDLTLQVQRGELYALLGPNGAGKTTTLRMVAGLLRPDNGDARILGTSVLREPEQAKRRLVDTFGRGMNRKLGRGAGLIHDPEARIPDEPLTALDAAAARSVKDLLTDFVASGKTVILTTHIMEIAERMAERIGIISQGR